MSRRKPQFWLHLTLITAGTYLAVAVVLIAWYFARLVYLPEGLAIFDHPSKRGLVQVSTGGVVSCNGPLNDIVECGLVDGGNYWIIHDSTWTTPAASREAGGNVSVMEAALVETFCVLDAAGVPMFRGTRDEALAFIASRVNSPKIKWYPVHLVRPTVW
ncbi:MAG: hypothetical protein NTV94_19505 [Planctomycetota bacterium]|nr:hypothetical protein [Planctomycetota bacterium]